MGEQQKKYEISFLLRADPDYEGVIKILSKYEASIVGKSEITRIRLSYPIKKESFGYWGRAVFESAPQATKEIDRELKTAPGVLRFMITNSPSTKSAPQERERIKPTSTPLGDRSRAELKEKLFREAKKPTGYPRSEEDKSKAGKSSFGGELSNEALEKKLEEILG